jgi:hypothetical protein
VMDEDPKRRKRGDAPRNRVRPPAP